jgi:hypothetical protein
MLAPGEHHRSISSLHAAAALQVSDESTPRYQPVSRRSRQICGSPSSDGSITVQDMPKKREPIDDMIDARTYGCAARRLADGIRRSTWRTLGSAIIVKSCGPENSS